MKTRLTRGAAAIGAALGLTCASLVIADQQTTQQTTAGKDILFKGTVTAVDLGERTVSAKALWSHKTFNVADNSKVSLEDEGEATLESLHPGQKVEITYHKDQGVMIARRIAQKNRVFTGHITAINPAERTVTVKRRAFNRDFRIADDTRVMLRNEKAGSLNDLLVGHTVNVIYERDDDLLTARRIEQKYETFAGTIRAIDAETRTVKAKSFLADKKFNLASGCRIIVDGKTEAALKDLRIGDRVVFSYEDSDGVLVANRIGLGETAPETESAQAAKATDMVP